MTNQSIINYYNYQKPSLNHWVPQMAPVNPKLIAGFPIIKGHDFGRYQHGELDKPIITAAHAPRSSSRWASGWVGSERAWPSASVVQVRSVELPNN